MRNDYAANAEYYKIEANFQGIAKFAKRPNEWEKKREEKSSIMSPTPHMAVIAIHAMGRNLASE